MRGDSFPVMQEPLIGALSVSDLRNHGELVRTDGWGERGELVEGNEGAFGEVGWNFNGDPAWL